MCSQLLGRYRIISSLWISPRYFSPGTHGMILTKILLHSISCQMIRHPFSLYTQKPANLFSLFSLSTPISNRSIDQSRHQDSRRSSLNTCRIGSLTLLPASRITPQYSAVCVILSAQNHASSTALIPVLREFPWVFRVKLKLPSMTKL